MYRRTPFVPRLPGSLGGPLRGFVDTDVCVLGGGVAGLTVAYLAAREGLSVVLLDGPARAAPRSASDGQISTVIDDGYAEIERIHGVEGARLVAQSQRAALCCIQGIADAERIDCEFTRLDAYWFANAAAAQALERECAAARRAGVQAAHAGLPLRMPRAPHAVARFPDQAQLEPERYLDGLKRAAERAGVRFFGGQCGVYRVPARCPTLQIQTAEGGRLQARRLVIASAVKDRAFAASGLAETYYTRYAVTLPVPRGAVPGALYRDMAQPVRQVRVLRAPGRSEAAEDLIVVSGQDRSARAELRPAERYQQLERWARRHFPVHGSVRHCWSAPLVKTLDGLGCIGYAPSLEDNVFVASGDSGMDFTHGTIAGMLLADLLAGRDNCWAPLYNPARRPLHTIARSAAACLPVLV